MHYIICKVEVLDLSILSTVRCLAQSRCWWQWPRWGRWSGAPCRSPATPAAPRWHLITWSPDLLNADYQEDDLARVLDNGTCSVAHHAEFCGDTDWCVKTWRGNTSDNMTGDISWWGHIWTVSGRTGRVTSRLIEPLIVRQEHLDSGIELSPSRDWSYLCPCEHATLTLSMGLLLIVARPTFQSVKVWKHKMSQVWRINYDQSLFSHSYPSLLISFVVCF